MNKQVLVTPLRCARTHKDGLVKHRPRGTRWWTRSCSNLATLRRLASGLVLCCACVPRPAEPPQVPEGVWQVHEIELPDRFTTHYLEAGPRDAPTVILLHGFPDAAYGWRYVIPKLASDYHVLAPTLRGYTGAELPSDGYDLPTLADDLRSFMAATGSERVHLLAHDWGAAIGWEAVTSTPDAFLSFTALDVPHPRAAATMFERSKTQRRYRKFVRKMVMPGAASYIAGLDAETRMKVFYLDRLQDDSPLRPQDAAYYNAAYDDRADVWGPIRYYKTLVRERKTIADRYASAGPVTVPTLVLWGKEDRNWLPALAKMSCEYVSARCEHEVFANAGHYLQWEKPEDVAAAWRAFVEAPEGDEQDSRQAVASAAPQPQWGVRPTAATPAQSQAAPTRLRSRGSQQPHTNPTALSMAGASTSVPGKRRRRGQSRVGTANGTRWPGPR